MPQWLAVEWSHNLSGNRSEEKLQGDESNNRSSHDYRRVSDNTTEIAKVQGNTRLSLEQSILCTAISTGYVRSWSLSGILLNTPPNDSERALDITQYTLTELISNCNYYTDKTSVWLMKYANNTFYKSMAVCVRSIRTHHTQKQAVSDQQDKIQTPTQIWDFCEMPQEVTYTFKHTVN